MRPHTKKKVGFVTLATVAISSSLAYAYWTGSGTGTGTASTGQNTKPLAVNQTSTVSDMGPGVAAQPLSGNFDNTNSGPVQVGTLTVSIASVTKNSVVVVGCDATDYKLTGATIALNKEIPVGLGVSSWSGASIEFVNKNVNQDACKGATVNLAYTLS